jgi:hypothetical protein
MIFVCVGLPGQFTTWCDGVIAALAEGLGGLVCVKIHPSLQEMFGYGQIPSTIHEAGLALVEGELSHLVLAARQPDPTLRDALANANARFVVALDDPRIAVGELIGGDGPELRTATRVVANSCPSILSYLSMTGALVLHADRAGKDPCAAAQQIADHFRICSNATEIARIVEKLSSFGLTPRGAVSSAWPDLIPEPGRKMVDGALGAYAERFSGRSMGRIVWTRHLFMLAANSAEQPTEPLDVSGGARNLIFGPYIHLPPGTWIACAVLGFSKEATGHIFLVDVAAGPRLGLARLQPSSAGIFDVNITFSLEAQTNTEVELRVMVGEDCARGELAFGHVILTPLLPQGPENLSAPERNFIAVLDL